MTDAQHGDEGRRQAYLAALGIPLWSARVELPGALPSAPLAFVPYVVAPDAGSAGAEPVAAAPTREKADEPAASVAIAAAGAPSGVSPQPPARVPDFSPSSQAPSRPQQPVATESAAPVQDPRLPRLSCRVWALAPGLCAVIALDDVPDLSAAEHRLLDNIARALDAAEPPRATGDLLRWPLNRNPALDHGPEALRVWLGHALRLPPGRCVVFGEALASHVASALAGRSVIVAPALADLLADASAKRRLWQALHG